MDWIQRLGLPPACDAGGRAIPKATLVRQGNLTKLEEKRLRGIERLELCATLQKSNTYMPPVSDDTYQVDAVICLRCELRAGGAPADVAELLHPMFPNPTVILFERGGEAAVSVAVKRKSLAERGAVVVEAVENSGLFDPSQDVYSEFLDELRYERLPQGTLLEFVQAAAARVQLAKAARTLGFYPKCPDGQVVQFKGHLEKMTSLQSRINELQAARRDPDVGLNDSSKLRIEIKKLEKERDKQAAILKELCHE